MFSCNRDLALTLMVHTGSLGNWIEHGCLIKVLMKIEDMENCDIPENFIQIKATGSEMRSRISALMACKRRQANRRNELDFFGMQRKKVSHCARVAAQVNRRKGEASHLQVRFAWNAWGPQTTHAADLKERCTSIGAGVVDPPPSTSIAAATQAAPSSSQFNFSTNQEFVNHTWKIKSCPEAMVKKRAFSLDDIEMEIKKLKKKMKS
ncbi:uncharacterized protein LOC111047429 isoform X4 [Nilaparvata lugens]|uniref:uncharacterized protein LOC111047429 isoform X4 n=1 Tax=Nilaparvata lugens TaxID=108931 RepID=UPI00193EADA3|nr:uncharacterized protein LOC111047429 isoform X4 [Nilaparvata lugens]